MNFSDSFKLFLFSATYYITHSIVSSSSTLPRDFLYVKCTYNLSTFYIYLIQHTSSNFIENNIRNQQAAAAKIIGVSPFKIFSSYCDMYILYRIWMCISFWCRCVFCAFHTFWLLCCMCTLYEPTIELLVKKGFKFSSLLALVFLGCFWSFFFLFISSSF